MDDELCQTLNRRLNKVENEGTTFESPPPRNDLSTSRADVSCYDRLETQFTPKNSFAKKEPAWSEQSEKSQNVTEVEQAASSMPLESNPLPLSLPMMEPSLEGYSEEYLEMLEKVGMTQKVDRVDLAPCEATEGANAGGLNAVHSIDADDTSHLSSAAPIKTENPYQAYGSESSEVSHAPHEWSRPVSSTLLPVRDNPPLCLGVSRPILEAPSAQSARALASSHALSPPPAAQGITYVDEDSDLVEIPVANLVTDHSAPDECTFGGPLRVDLSSMYDGTGTTQAFENANADLQPQMQEEAINADFAMDSLAVSSSPYFRATHQRQQEPKNERSDVASAATVSPGNSAFPQPRGSVLQSKVAAVSAEIEALQEESAQILAGRSVRPAELRRLLQDADALRASMSLRDDELADVPSWPSDALRQIRSVAKAIDSWESCMAGAQQCQQLLAAQHQAVPLEQIVKQLFSIITAWQALQFNAQRTLNVDLNLDQRARVASPMVSVLLDEAMLMSRVHRSSEAARQLMEMVIDRRYRECFRSLDVALPVDSTVTNLHKPEVVVNSLPKELVPCVVAKDVLWNAIMQEDVSVVEALAKQAALPSGQATLDQNVTVFWSAIEFQKMEVAHCLMQLFPPSDTGSGIDVLEVHPQRGDTLLHLICYCKNFTSRTAELFQTIFQAKAAGHSMKKNIRGETFLHVAARNLNFWILQFAVSQGLEGLTSVGNVEGRTPLMLMEKSIRQWRGPLLTPSEPSSVLPSVPSWFQLSKLAPAKPGDQPSLFHDIAMEINDEKAGAVLIYAHRVVLAASSPVLCSLVSQASFSDSEQPILTLKIEPQYCRSTRVVCTALEFLYRGEFCCDFEDDGGLLWQLLCLCLKYQLPQPLHRCSSLALLRALNRKQNVSVIGVLLRGGRQAGLQVQEQQFVARCFACTPSAFLAVEETKRPKTLQTALSILETCVA